MSSVFSFKEIDQQVARERAGGKAEVLIRLYHQSFPVPDGFVVLPAAFSGEELRPEAWKQIAKQLSRLRLGSKRTAFAVRSSAMVEDSARASFAGEFETVLNAESDQEVKDAIHAVRGSIHSERVRSYSEAKGVEAQTDISVIVQLMVDARMSGVLFTADPITGSRTAMVGRYAYGTGDRLVSGEEDGLAFRMALPKGRYEGPDELRPHAGGLYKLARLLEQELGDAQDIEWAIGKTDGGSEALFLLQSRPITTLAEFDPATGDWNTSYTGDYLWSNVNFGEAVTEAMTPLSWTVLRHVLREWVFVPGCPTVGSIGGRPYLNISAFATAFHAVGRSEEQLLRSLEGTLFLRLPPAMTVPLIPLSMRHRFATAYWLIKLALRQMIGLRQIKSFLAGNPRFCDQVRQRIDIASTQRALHDLWCDVIDPHIRRSAWIVLGIATHSSDYTVKLRRDLVELAGVEDADYLLAGSDDVSGGPSGRDLMPSLGPLVNITRVAQGEMQKDEYLSRFGHRGPHEFELAVPRPAEDPSWLESQLVLFGQSPVDVDLLLEKRRNAFNVAWERLQAQHPRKAPSIRRRIDESRRRAGMREAARSEYVRDRWLVRKFALRAGQLTGLGDDVFYLTLDELLAALSGGQIEYDAVPARKQTVHAFRELGPCPSVIRGRFDPNQWAADPQRRTDSYDAYADTDRDQSNMIRGAPGSAGRVQGSVRCLKHPDEGEQLLTGEILVAAQTDIAWTPLFPRAAAIITDVGAPLSHAAIVARELGIAAVVGCGDATMRLRTGDIVRVDGGRGTVEILSSYDNH